MESCCGMEDAVVSKELPAEDRAPEDRAIGRPCGRGRVLHFVVVPETKNKKRMQLTMVDIQNCTLL